LAVVTSAVTTPRWAADSSTKAVIGAQQVAGAAVAGHQAQELGGQQLELGLGGHGGQALGLVLGREGGALDQAAQVGALGGHRPQRFQVGLDLGQLVALDRQFEQGLRIALTRIRRLGFVRHLFRPVRCNRRGQED
jgi:hypothetical protein